ncbi:helix-turn-helix domain-containing protein [Nakamurella deserti]|uniref:helix-turn-helix domain-containing protein n=1 Tax=Nakamurella deserti TaxID=2164074 RepID=UPI000DBE9E2F|nr:GAF domain-containing protein [Nakamurella deserti]
MTEAPSDELRRWLSAVETLSAAVTSGRDLTDVLDLVAATARDLLGFDFCAVLIPDEPARTLVITGWSGLSVAYVERVNADRPVRLDAADPVLAPSSRAFRSGAPVTIDDIADEPDFPWSGVAREQGYRSMVSVPLRSGPAVVGTLNGYYVTAHRFSDQELERLALLANHAAIALASATLLTRLSRLNASLRDQRDLLHRSEEIHEQLLVVSVRGGGVPGLARSLSGLVERAVLIEDARGDILASAGDPAALPGDADRAGGDADRAGGDADAPHTAWDVRPVELDGETVARLWWPREPPLSALDRRAVDHAAVVVSLELARLRTGQEAEYRLRGELLADLLAGVPVDEVRERATRLGHDLDRPHVAVVGRVTGTAGSGTALQRALRAVSALAATEKPRPLVAVHRGDLVVLWPAPDDERPGAPDGGPAAAIRRTMAAAAPGATTTVAVAGSPTPRDHTRAYRTARGSLDLAVRAGRTGTVLTLDDLGVTGLLLQLDDPAQLLAFADRTLGPVRRHDAERGTQLLRTLRTHLDSGLHRAETARRAHVHVNTVAQRLHRIETLTGLDLTAPATLVEIGAAMTLLEVAGVGG